MVWNELTALEQVEQIKRESAEQAILIFKHSTRCNISRASLDRLERQWREKEMGSVKTYCLDLLRNRQLSQRLAEEFRVDHESPQILLIRNGESILDQSHFGIDYDDIRMAVKN